MNQVDEAHTVLYFLCSQGDGDQSKDAIGHDHKMHVERRQPTFIDYYSSVDSQYNVHCQDEGEQRPERSLKTKTLDHLFDCGKFPPRR